MKNKNFKEYRSKSFRLFSNLVGRIEAKTFHTKCNIILLPQFTQICTIINNTCRSKIAKCLIQGGYSGLPTLCCPAIRAASYLNIRSSLQLSFRNSVRKINPLRKCAASLEFSNLTQKENNARLVRFEDKCIHRRIFFTLLKNICTQMTYEETNSDSSRAQC